MVANGTIKAEVSYRFCEGVKVPSTLWDMWKKMHLLGLAKMGMFEGKEVPTVLNGCEACVLHGNVWKRINVLYII